MDRFEALELPGRKLCQLNPYNSSAVTQLSRVKVRCRQILDRLHLFHPETPFRKIAACSGGEGQPGFQSSRRFALRPRFTNN